MYSKYAYSLMRSYRQVCLSAAPLIGCLFVFAWAVPVQPQSAAPVIDAGNIAQLAPAVVVDFGALPPEAGEVVNGRVYVNPDASRVAVVNRSGQSLLFDGQGVLLEVTDVILTEDGFPATFIDGAFDPTGSIFAALHTAGSGYYVTLHARLAATQIRFEESDDRPTAIWLDGQAIWLEVLPNSADDPYVVSFSLDGALAAAEPTIHPYAPAQDVAAVARIGRLPMPFAVTTTATGLVSRWDLQTGILTATAQVEGVPIYGALTPDGRYLAWRDPASVALNLLDFESGNNHQVVKLDGTYTPFILLSIKADVIMGVNVNDEPIIVTWNTQRGERLELGLYRQCGRPPDMVVLSRDGTTLVVGCDQGFEIWRVKRE